MYLSPAGMRMLMVQIQDLRANPEDGITLETSDNLMELDAELLGPEGTPYAGGLYHITLTFLPTFPQQPPKGTFKTTIFHPNVSEKGEICVNVLKKDWDASLGLRHVLTVVRCLLIEPNAESALNDEAGKLILEDYDSFARKATMFTKIHAVPRAIAAGINRTKLTSGSATTSPSATLSGDRLLSSQLAEEPCGGSPIARGSPGLADCTTGQFPASGEVGALSPPALHETSASGLRNVASTNTHQPAGTAATKSVQQQKAVDKKKAALKRI